MNLFKKYLKSKKKLIEILSFIKKNDKTEISEGSREIASLISLLLKEEINKTIVLVAPNIFQAQKLYDTLSKTEEDTFFYPKDDFLSMELLTESFDFKLQRINTLKTIFQGSKPKIIVANLASLLSKTPTKQIYKSKIKELKPEYIIKPQKLITDLVENGYERVYTIEKQGEVAIRGSIVDIYPINDDKAYRIDFFGDEIESIKVLDIETQRSQGTTNNLIVMPKSELLFSETEKETIRFYINDKLSQNVSLKTKEKLEKDLEYLENNSYNLLEKYLYIFNQDNYSFIDYIDDKVVVFYDYDNILKQEVLINDQTYEYLSNFDNYFKTDFLNKLFKYHFEKEIYITNKKKYSELKEIKLSSKDIINYNGRLDLLKEDLEREKKTIIISLEDKKLEIIKDYFVENNIKFCADEDEIKENQINILNNEGIIPLNIDELNLLSLTEDKIFKSYAQGKGKYKLSVETKRLKSISELKVGDYVVHEDYGIGKFLEINTMSLSGHDTDFIHIKYDKDQSLYIPVEKLYVLSKYSGSESYIPKLSNLNSKEWAKTKANTKKKVQELAQRLLNLYSEREKIEGFKYLKDDDVQKEFESEFEYELTKDQIQAIKDVKDDMESNRLMDRLICGDVGFGKTEVALRAAFKAVLSGKQVACLAPTTILARQHYYTFKQRMDKYGINTALVSRFVGPKAIKKSLFDLSRGVIDVIVGTHRLLSKDVKYNNLGLLIIDEEQRFGVEAKERMKEMKTNIDVLTLTATPIPRTLQMAVTGIKNVSLIETAPKGRYPVQTYVLERNDYIVKDAIEREISKSGQIFYLYNRVEDIEKIVSYVASLVPEARIACIHGRMEKNKIEDTIEAFINRETDVLISTTIIETGVDIPNANTLIVHDAERYGLSQLYQIKGRVGRSDKISYAYLMYDKNTKLTEDAIKRLKAIKDFTELGSGFKIAIRDLTTRGAGEILGHEQSGFMDKVGVDLYLRMLDEEIKKQTNKEETESADARIIMSRHISKDYISDDYCLIEVHTKISKLETKKQLLNLVQELEDRFGKVEDTLLEYMYTKLSENLINKCGFERVEAKENSILFVISSERSKIVDAPKIFKYSVETSQDFSFYIKAKKIFIVYQEPKSKLNMYKNISEYLEKIKKDNLL